MNEPCKACALKHLSDALLWLDDTEKPEIVRNAYISGNLSHASAHLIEEYPQQANDIRELRLEILDNDLVLTADKESIQKQIEAAIQSLEVSTPRVVTTTAQSGIPKKSGGCGCGKKR